MQINHISNTINYSQNRYNNHSTSSRQTFKGGIAALADSAESTVSKSQFFAPVKKFFSPLTTKWKNGMNNLQTRMAKGFVSILDTKRAEGFISKIKKSNYVAHFSAGTSIILSAFYVKKTLENKNLDPQKRKTLAINQGSVCVLSTILAYGFEKSAQKQVNKFIDKFIITNVKADIKDLVKYQKGIKAASKMMIFGMMYRFVSPVAVTPVANHIGNKLEGKKAAKLAAASK